MFLRIKAYAPNGASLGVMPSPLKVSASLPMNDHGALSLEYGLAAPKPDALASPCEFAVEVSRDGTTWSEPRNARFLYLRRGGDDLKQPARIQAEGLGYAWRLQTAKVLPINDGRADGKRAFLSQNPGTILRALITEAQSRGALRGLAYDFSENADSAGNAWADKLTIYYEPGMDLLTLTRNLADQGIIDFWTEGRTLRVFNSESLQSARRLEVASPSAVVLREGRDMTEAPYKGTWENLADYAYVRGDGGVSLEKVQNAVMPWGRQEVFITNGGVSDEGTMNLLADSSLALASGERVERTFGLTLTDVPFQPMLDYAPGDYVGVRLVGKPQAAYRCRQVTLERDAQANVSGNVVLNDKFLEAEVRQNRRVQGITNGAQSSGGSGATPTPAETPPDETPPAVPTNTAVATETYTTPQGDDRAVARLSWAEVVTNYNGTPTSDVERYEVRWKTAVATPSGTPQALSPATAHASLNALWDRRGKAWGWIGGDGAASIRKPDGKDVWLFGDSAVGQIGTDWKLAKGQPWGMVNNALVETDPADRTYFRTMIGAPNLLPAEFATWRSSVTLSTSNATYVVAPEPSAYGGRALEVKATAAGGAYVYAAGPATAVGLRATAAAGDALTVRWKARGVGLAAARTAQFYLLAYDSAGKQVTMAGGATTTLATDGTVAEGANKLTVPANAVEVRPIWIMNGAAAGEAARFFDLGLYRGDQLHSSWSLPMGHAYEAIVRPEAAGWKAADYQNYAGRLDAKLRQTPTAKVTYLGDELTADTATSGPAGKLHAKIRGQYGAGVGLSQHATAGDVVSSWTTGASAASKWAAVKAAGPGAGVAVWGKNDVAGKTAAAFAQDAAAFVDRWASETGGQPLTFALWVKPSTATASPWGDYAPALRSALAGKAVDVVTLADYLPASSTSWLNANGTMNAAGADAFALAMFNRLQDPTGDYYWIGDGWAYGGKVYALCQIVGQYWPTPDGWNFTYRGRTDVARWDAATMKLESVQPFATSPVSWTDATHVEGSFLYVWGHLADGSACLSRVPVATPYAGLAAWDGSTWNADTSKAVALISGRTVSSVRRIGATFHAYYVDGVNVKEATAPSLTGTWSLNPTPVYRMPEVAGQNYAYIPRQHTQFDGPAGLVFGYSQNTNADWANGPDGLSHVGPRFAKGPAATPKAPNMDNVAWMGSVATTEPAASVSPLLPGTAFYAEVRAIDQAGNASANSAKVEAWAPIGPTVTDVRTVPPNRPSAPIVSPFFQGVTVYWDGLDYTAGTPASSWRRVEVYVSAVDGFYPSPATYVGELPETGGTLPVHGLRANVPYFARLVAVDRNGNRSDASEQGGATTAQLVNADLPEKLVEAANVADGAISVRNLNVAGWSDSLAPNLDFEGDWTGAVPYGWVAGWWMGNGETSPAKVTGSESVTGATSWRHTVTPGNGRIWRGPVVPVQERVVYYWSVRIKTSRAVTDGLDFGLAYGATEADASGWTRMGLTNGPIRNDDGTTTFYGRGEIPAGMKYAAPVLVLYPETNQASPYTVTVGGVEFKQIVGGANIAEASIQNAHISYLDLNVGNVSVLNAGKISAGTMSALVTLSGEFRSQDGRWRAGSYGTRTYDAGGNIITEMRASDGGLVSQWFRTATTGSRIEMGTYSMGAGSSLIAFYSDSSVWQFPPAMGYGGGSRTNFPGIAMHAGSLTASAYNQYGMNMIGVDQRGGISLVTGNRLNSTTASDGAPITLDANGAKGIVNIFSGGDNAKLSLSPTYGSSYLTLAGGVVKFSNANDQGLYIGRSAAWQGLGDNHLIISAVNGVRVTAGSSRADFMIEGGGLIKGSGAWDTPKIKVRNQDSYISWNSSGDAYIDGNPVKSFVIDHPDDPARRLVHACVEMPEARVAYEGTAAMVGRWATVRLPQYVAALTVPGSDVVTVTPHECRLHGLACSSVLRASRVRAGGIDVRRSGGYDECELAFSWRVSAVRRGTDFAVEPLKSETRVYGDGPYTYLA